MRVIVVDNDSTMLEATVRALREHFVIDAVTNKADCIDLLRQNEFDIVIACERLEDGSGLELLGQIAKRWPATLRVFAADRERLRLLQGKLAPFELFQALSYPINPDKLLATLSLARDAHAAHADTTTIQHIVLGGDDSTESEPEPPPPPPPPAPRAKPVGASTRAPTASSTMRPQNSVGRGPSATLAAGRGPMTFDASFPLGSSGADSSARAGSGSSGSASQARSSAASGAPAAPARTSAAAPARTSAAAPARTSTGSPPAPASSARMSTAPPASASAARAGSPARSTPDEGASANQPSSARAWSGRTFARSTASAGGGATPTDSLAEAASIAAAARSRLEPDESDSTPTHRKAFIAGAGCAVALFVVGFLVLEFRSGPTLTPTPPPPIPRAPQYSKEVTDQVSEVETDFETDDFKKAQADVRTLQAMAPGHPRLQFFKTLIDRGLKGHAVAGHDSAGPWKLGPSRKLTAAATTSGATPAGSGTTGEPKASASPPPGKASLSSTFSGRTIEESTTPRTTGAATGGTASPEIPTAAGPATGISNNATAPMTGATGSTAAPTNATTNASTDNAGTTPANALTSAAGPASPAAAPIANASNTTLAAAAPAANASNSPAAAAPASEPTNSTGTSSAAAEPRRTPHSAIPTVTADAQLTRRVAPDYPDSAVRKGIQGYVDVQFTITAQGNVTNVAVVSSDPGEVFDRAATDAVRRWRYDPRVVDGQPVDSQSQVRLQFRLDQSLSH